MSEIQYIIVVQQIYTYWTKQSRGHIGASQRNSAPQIAPITVPNQIKSPLRPMILYHLIEYSERSDFKPNEKYILDPSVYPYYGCVAVEHNTTHVWTTYRYQMSKGGAPDRLLKTRTLKTSLDEWAQVVENGRFSTEEEWSYQKVVTNVGLMSRFEPLFFMSKSPQASFSSLAELW